MNRNIINRVATNAVGRRPTSHRASRHGATLIDVAAGTMLLALLLIPSVHLIGESQSANRRLTNRETMLYEAEQLIEKTKVAVADPVAFTAAWSLPSGSDSTTNIVVGDGPGLLGRVRVGADRSLAPPAQLLTIDVDVWLDADGDRRLDANEQSESLRTQWAAP